MDEEQWPEGVVPLRPGAPAPPRRADRFGRRLLVVVAGKAEVVSLDAYRLRR